MVTILQSEEEHFEYLGDLAESRDMAGTYDITLAGQRRRYRFYRGPRASILTEELSGLMVPMELSDEDAEAWVDAFHERTRR